MKRVGILRGGAGEHYEFSLQKGGDLISHIFENLSHKYKTFDILIDKQGIWHINGVPINPADLVHRVDVVWNVAGPEFSIILQNFSIPFIGQSFFSGSMENSKDILREHMKKIGLKMPRTLLIPAYFEDIDARPTERGQSFGRGPRERYAIKKAKEIHEKFGSPWIIKSFTEDSGMVSPVGLWPRGIHLAKTFNELVAAIEDGVNHGKSIFVEEFIAGKPTALHSIANFRGENIYILPPENLTAEEKEKLTGLVKDLHHHLDARHYLKSDFILHPKRGVFLTEINFSPDLRKNSHLDKSLGSVGAKLDNMVEHILESTL